MSIISVATQGAEFALDDLFLHLEVFRCNSHDFAATQTIAALVSRKREYYRRPPFADPLEKIAQRSCRLCGQTEARLWSFRSRWIPSRALYTAARPPSQCFKDMIEAAVLNCGVRWVQED